MYPHDYSLAPDERAQGFDNIAVLHGGLLRFASKFEPAIIAAAGLLPHQLVRVL
jgi:hypothetical protein